MSGNDAPSTTDPAAGSSPAANQFPDAGDPPDPPRELLRRYRARMLDAADAVRLPDPNNNDALTLVPLRTAYVADQLIVPPDKADSVRRVLNERLAEPGPTRLTTQPFVLTFDDEPNPLDLPPRNGLAPPTSRARIVSLVDTAN